MSQTLLVRLKKAEGCLVRLLGQIGRRGYDVLSVSAKLGADRKTFDVEIEFQPFQPVPPAPPLPRPAELLPSLVAKLCEVEKVELKGAAAKPVPLSRAESREQPSGNGSDHEAKPKAAKPVGDMKFEDPE